MKGQVLHLLRVQLKVPGDSSDLSVRIRANARNVSTSFLPYGVITYLINSFDYPSLLNHRNCLVMCLDQMAGFAITSFRSRDFSPSFLKSLYDMSISLCINELFFTTCC